MINTTLKTWRRHFKQSLSSPLPRVLTALGFMLLASGQLHAAATVTTLGGGSATAPYSGYKDGNTLSVAKFAMPTGMALDPSGTALFIADYTNNAIRVVSNLGNAATSVTTTFANATNNGGIAGISHPLAVVVDSATNVYVLNHGNGNNGAVLHLSGVYLNSGLVLVYPPLASNLVNATAMAMDGFNNLYITVNGNTVKRVTPGGVITTLGTVSQAGTALQGIAVLDNGQLALSDAGNNGIWVMNPVNGTSIRLTGFHGSGDTNGPAAFASFNKPATLAKAGGGILVVADNGNHKVKLVDQAGGVSLLYGVSSNLWVKGPGEFPGWFDGPGTPTQGSAESRLPYGVLVGPDGSVYATEDYYHVLRHITGTGLAAPQPGYPQVFNTLSGIALDPSGSSLYIADFTNNAVQLLNFGDNLTATFLSSSDGISRPASVLVDPSGYYVYVLNQGALGSGSIQQYDIFGFSYGPIATGLIQPTAFTMDGLGHFFVTEQAGSIRAFGVGVSNTVVTITNANVSLQGIAIFDDGQLAVSDAGNHVIWTVNPLTKFVRRLTGQLGVSGATLGFSNSAKLYQPHQLARAGNNQIVIADYGNNRLVTSTRAGAVTNVLNSTNSLVWTGRPSDPMAGSNLLMRLPAGVAVSSVGLVYDSEPTNHAIRGLNVPLTAPSSAPIVPLPFFGSPQGIALNNSGTKLFIADPTNNMIGQLDLGNNLTTVFLDSSSGIYQPVDVALDSSDNLYVLNQGTGGNGSIIKFDQYGNLLGTSASSLSQPTAMKLDFSGNIYVSELNGAVQEFYTNGSNATLATIATNANVRLQGIALLDDRSVVVSDAGNQVLWKIAPAATNAVLFTGVLGSPGTNFGAVGFAKLNKPMRLAQAFGGLLIVDSGNNRVVVANDLGTVSSALKSTNAILWFGSPNDPVSAGSPNFVPMLSPVGVAIGMGTNGIVFSSEDVYKDIRGMLNTGIQAPIPPPPAPQDLVATATYGQVSLRWSAVTGATNYNVQRSPSTGGPYTSIANTSATSFTDTNVLGGSTYYYVVSAVNSGGLAGPNSAEVSARPLIPAPPAPRIGWFDYEGNDLTGFFSVLHPVSIVTFNNDQLLAVDPVTNGVSTYYIYGPAPLASTNIPSSANGTTPPFYQDGRSSQNPLTPLFLAPLPDMMIEAINVDSVGQSSPITTAEFKFQVANPQIGGFNGAQFSISDITRNAVLWYTLDGTTPTDAPPSIGPITLNSINAATLSIVVTSNVLFQVRGFRAGYSPSGIAAQNFSSSNFVANVISFGFGSGEASSDFVGSPGQTFYAPVTLSTLSGTIIYSLQFNVTVTNAGPNAGPAVAANNYGFQTMLMKPDPKIPGLFHPIPPFAFETSGLNPPPDSSSVFYNGDWYQSLEATNTLNNLLTVGWLERAGKTNLYDTTSQDLIKYSLAHDDLFPNAQTPNGVILGGYAFGIPAGATNGQTYQIQIGRPSATRDGIGAPGSDVFIAAPTNGATAGGSPMNALKFVTVGQRKYIAGSVYPFNWFNAGDFGSSNIVNADVEQVFQSAIYGLNTPPPGSDFFDAMDSCGATYVDLGHGYLEFNSFISGPAATDPLFDGNDTSINQIAFGDEVLDVCDVYVTFRRSLDPSLTWFQRYWNNGQRVAVSVPNVAPRKVASPRNKTNTVSSADVQVNFTAGDIQGSAGQTIQVPITATIFGGYPLRVLMLNLTVTPLDGSPPLTAPVQFNQTASIGSAYTTDSQGNGNFSAVWLNRAIAGVTNTGILGNLTVTIPAGAPSNAAYAVHFDHASASPNGLASFPRQTFTGLITTTARTNSTFGDGIPDAWRLRWFGTINNYLSLSNSCPSGDGVSNWKKFVAGVDPNTANNFPSVNSKLPVPSGSTTAIHWPTVSGKQYAIERSTSLFPGAWTAIGTNTGTGGDMEFDDNYTGKVKFYRVQILP